MALTLNAGPGPLLPVGLGALNGSPSLTGVGPIDATGEKIAFVGRVWLPNRGAATKDVRRVCFRFGSVTKAGGSGLTISLQDVNLTAGPPGQPDETQDQTVAVANGDATFASNTWHRSGVLSADRTVTHGGLLAVVIEYDGSGRQGADSVQLSCPSWGMQLMHSQLTVLKTASWASSSVTPNIVLEMSDGTFGTFSGAFPCSAITSHDIASNTGGADEYALAFVPGEPMGVESIWAPIAVTANFDLVLYSGTTPLATVSIDANTPHSSGARSIEGPFAEQSLTAGQTYYAAIKPTTTTPVSMYSFDVDDANHLTLHGEGPDWNYSTRLDEGSWAAVTTTRRMFAGVRLSSRDDGSGGGAASMMRPVAQSGGLV